ncbi:beta-galactosidase [Micromonospora sp. KC721]|uniref:beta-galactosidase n=1 Tax=Micromonospora sp. KC721 TaxID=2530380 RepID=UPI00104EDB66|nr:beta-galactosidase [Micromonospora sp. KC721]TDB74225.1 beta-galactosidase [Micromonospora sp. KC721]
MTPNRGAGTPAVDGGETTRTGSEGAEATVGGRHAVTYDRHSLLLDGRRILVQSAELHYFRLPSPDLWRDVLEKIRSAGFNTVSLYFHWAYHSPKPGGYDFTGVRDVDRLLHTVNELGLWAIARPGPYINAETTGGGFPAWLKLVPGRARTSAPGYTAAYTEWLDHLNPIIARHQVTRGGPVLLYNVENEYQVNTDAAYMQAVQDKARADGIDVPVVTNICCGADDRASTWHSGVGAVQIPGMDDYPQSFDCTDGDAIGGSWGEGVTRRIRDDAPIYAAEYQAGSIDVTDAGYERCRELTGPEFMRLLYKNNAITGGATLFSYYMTYGGTNWGWLAQPDDVYTSYDYGAAITEGRQLTAKYDEFKRQGYLLTTVAPLTRTNPAAAPTVDNPALLAAARTNPDTGTQFVLLRHRDRTATSDDSGVLDWSTPDGRYRVPVRVVGRDAAILVAGYDLGGQRLVWSTSEIMTHAAIDGRDVAVLYGTRSTAGSAVLRYPTRPEVRVIEGAVASSYDPTSGDLRLDYRHDGLARVLVTDGGRRPALLLLGTHATVAPFWRVETNVGPVLVRGTSLVRSAAVTDDTTQLRADTDAAATIEVFASARRLSVNGRPVTVRTTSSGSLVGRLPGPQQVRLPGLTGWRTHAEAPEADPRFDDSRWLVADRTTSLSPYPPITLPVLYADEYGYHYGNVWYRSRFTATGAETAVRLNAITGRRGSYLVWLNGRYLGAAAGGVEADAEPINPNPGPGTFPIPDGVLTPGEPAVLSVLVENMGHNDDWTADDNRMRQPRGLVGAELIGSTAALSWRIQGARGGEELSDRARGPLNNGGLHGERYGWSLPGYPDGSWRRVRSLAGRVVAPGVTWYRTTFRLDLPSGQDTSVALRFADAPPIGHRVMLFLNGWNLGLYGGGMGPQRDFVLPAGLLRHHGANTLALAVTARQSSRLGPVSLVALGTQRGGVPVGPVPASDYDPGA